MAVNADTAEAELIESESTNEGGPVAEPPAGEVAAGESTDTARKRRRVSANLVVGAGLVVVIVALGSVCGWLGHRVYQAHQAEQQRELYVQVARQGALNLTTIDHAQADQDVRRILDSATGQFYDDFSKRSGPFIEVVKQAQSKSVGTVADAGLESEGDNEAQVMVAVKVETSNAGAPEQQPRAWRMRVTVQKVGEDVKVSNVGFVP
jgi:Mce-associated membrane protein